MFLFLFCLEKFDLFEAALSRVCSLPSPGKVFLKEKPSFPPCFRSNMGFLCFNLDVISWLFVISNCFDHFSSIFLRFLDPGHRKWHQKPLLLGLIRNLLPPNPRSRRHSHRIPRIHDPPNSWSANPPQRRHLPLR